MIWWKRDRGGSRIWTDKTDKKQRAFRKESMQKVLSIYLKASRSWIQSIRTIVQPIRDDISKYKNYFDE